MTGLHATHMVIGLGVLGMLAVLRTAATTARNTTRRWS